jgi:hypothetical protein
MKILKVSLNKTENNTDIINKFGYDTKQAMHSIRVLKFLEDYTVSFDNFGDCLRRSNNRQMLLDIKHGLYPYESYLTTFNHFMYKITKLKSIYHSKKPNKEINTFVLERVKQIIKCELTL